MKIVKELPEIFDEFGEQRRKAFLEIKQYKEQSATGTAPAAIASSGGKYAQYIPTTGIPFSL